MFNIVDVILIVVLISFIIAGYMHGFLKALGSIVSFVLAMIAGSYITSFLIQHYHLNLFSPSSMVLLIVAFAVVALLIGFVVGFIVDLLDGIRKMASIIPFTKIINSVLGAVLGFCEGIIFVSAVFIFTESYSQEGKVRAAILGSQMAHWFSGIAHVLAHIFPTVGILS